MSPLGLRPEGSHSHQVRRPYHNELLSAGDVYYLVPGHLPPFEEDSEVVEFSPKGEYQKTMEVAERNLAAIQQQA